MRIRAAHKQIIDEAIHGGWHFLTQRADIPPLPAWLKIKSSSSQQAKALYGVQIPWACFWHRNEVEFYLHGAEYRRTVSMATELLYSLAKTKKHLAETIELCRLTRRAALPFYTAVPRDFSDAQLRAAHQAIARAYATSFSSGFVTWCAQAVQRTAMDVVVSRTSIFETLGLTPDAALGILITSELPTPYRSKERALNALSQTYQRLVRKRIRTGDLARRFPALQRRIVDFLERYRWVGYDYNGPALHYGDVLQEISRRRVQQTRVMTKRELLRACKFSSAERSVFQTLALVAHTKDVRNATDDYVHYCLDHLYGEIARRHRLLLPDVKFLWPEELDDLFLRAKRPAQSSLKQKKKLCAAVSLSSRVGLKDYYVGQEARQLHRIISNSSQRADLPSQKAKVLRGTVASPGRVSGKVKIVHIYADLDKVKRGDILVAYMTSPKFMPAILRCGAIVTDEGGLLSHAAIISRELKIPCIVGTKVATQVFKDGDQVEFNTREGIVRKL